MEVSGQLHAPAALPPGKSPWYPLDRRLGGPQSRSGRGVGQNLLAVGCRMQHYAGGMCTNRGCRLSEVV
jgi:hypothetical protein